MLFAVKADIPYRSILAMPLFINFEDDKLEMLV
jgi:hypothetical protein